MRILIVAPRGVPADIANYQYLFPLGLAYISSVLKKRADWTVHCINLNHYHGSVEKILTDLIAQNGSYDIVCTGGLSTAYRQVKSITDAMRKIDHKTKLILGGGLITSEPELMFNDYQPDYIVVGEGEETIVELVKSIDQRGDPSEVAGIGYKDNKGSVIINKPRAQIMDLDSIPWPDLESFQFEKYLDQLHPTDQYFYDLYDHPRVYPIVCSRSCPYVCTFCFHPVGNKYRQRSIDSIMEEIMHMVKRYRINTIAIYDELFSHNKEWLYEFCRRIKAFFNELDWECKWCCQMRVDRVDDEMLKIMKEAGCFMVSYGFESFSMDVLKSMKKYITPQQIDNAVKLTYDNRISIQANFIFGDEAETLETGKTTLDYWKQNLRAGIILGFINPYPGTELYKSCVKRGLIKDRIDFVRNHIYDVFNMSKSMTNEEFQKLKIEVDEANFNKVYAIPKTMKSEGKGYYSILVKCPHCKENIEYKNYAILFKYYFGIYAYCRSCRHRFFMASWSYKFIKNMLSIFYSKVPYRIKLFAENVFESIDKFKAVIRSMVIGAKSKNAQTEE